MYGRKLAKEPSKPSHEKKIEKSLHSGIGSKSLAFAFEKIVRMNSFFTGSEAGQNRPSQLASPSCSVRLSHVFSQYYRLGGVHARLRLHHQFDRSLGIDSSFLITQETQNRPQEEPRIYFLGLNGRSTIRLMRRRFQIAIERTKPEVAIYHYGGGDPALLTDLDGASRRILDLTCNFPNLDSWLQPCARLFDGILSVSQSACKIAQKVLPNWDRSRIQWWPQPILPPSNLARSSKPPKPLVLGYAGRIIRPQKRVERIPQICRLLDKRQTSYRFEFLGDGAERPALERALPQRPQFLFRGIRQGNDYWQILANRDVILLTSDHEGVPRVILEGMSLGVLPIVPKIDAEADRYAQSIDSRKHKRRRRRD